MSNFMNVGELREQLSHLKDDEDIYITCRIQYGTQITPINSVGKDKHGNTVITFDDSLLGGGS